MANDGDVQLRLQGFSYKNGSSNSFFKGKAQGTRSGDAKWSVKAGSMSVSENVDKNLK